jgi:mRNA-degrading endonuclease RelE of RelBE toxin-antitoxin system
MALDVILAPAAARDLDVLPSGRRAQVVDDLEAFAARPIASPPRLKQLRGFRPPLFRLRSGDYRLLFRTVGKQLHVYRIIDRKELERALSRLR